LVGARSLEHHFVLIGGFAGVTRSIAGFVLVVSSLMFILCCWGIYNWIRFHGPDRRRAPKAIRDRILAAHYGLPPQRVRRWQHAKRLVAYHDGRGVVRGATSPLGAWMRAKDDSHPVIKPNAFDILYLSARSRMWRRNNVDAQ
jgi:poly-beta-1,6-N-acetyl-D-glucosamine biosynthesis protein PgaD